MIKKLWVKWDGMDIDCVCEDHHKKCVTKPGEKSECQEYVAKFIEVDRTQEEAEKQIRDSEAALKKFERDLRNKIKQMNRFRVK